MNDIAHHLQAIRQRIADAARRSGRPPDSVTLVGVTKYVDAATARQLVAAGCRDLGESRPQQLWEKAEALRDLPVNWHLIGHLQSNKVARTLPYMGLIHSADSLRLLQFLQLEASHRGEPVRVLLEVNISGDAAKHGFPPSEMLPVLDHAERLSDVHIEGLMGMSGRTADPQQTRRQFARLRELRDELRRCRPQWKLPELSMGMSRDFEVAIQEGATLVRVGTALYEGEQG